MGFRKNELLGSYNYRREIIDKINSVCVDFYDGTVDSKDAISLIRNILWGKNQKKSEKNDC